VPLRFRVALWLNPMYYLVQVFRKPIYDGTIPAASLVLVSLGLSAVVLVSGWVYFCRRTDRMAYWS